MLITQRPSLAEEPVSDSRSRFVIEPLEPGFGYTLGNSLPVSYTHLTLPTNREV